MRLPFTGDPRGDQFFALCTYRRNGAGVVTPIWMAPVAGCWYGWTPSRSGKVRRIRHNPAVLVAASDFSGRPRTPWQPGRARLLAGSDAAPARRALAAKYGLKFWIVWMLMHLAQPRKRGGQPVGLEITVDHPG